MNFRFNFQIINNNLAILLRFSTLAVASLIAVAAVKLRGYSEFGEYLYVLALFQISVSLIASQNKDILIRALKIHNEPTLSVSSVKKHLSISVLQVIVACVIIYVFFNVLNLGAFRFSDENLFLIFFPVLMVSKDCLTGILLYKSKVNIVYLSQLSEGIIFVIFIITADIDLVILNYISSFVALLILMSSVVLISRKKNIWSVGKNIGWVTYWEIYRNNIGAGILKTMVKRLEIPMITLLANAEVTGIYKVFTQIFIPLTTIPDILVSQFVSDTNKSNFEIMLKHINKVGKRYFIIILAITLTLAVPYLLYLELKIDLEILAGFLLLMIASYLIFLQWYSRLITYIFDSRYLLIAASLLALVYLSSLFLLLWLPPMIALGFANLLAYSVSLAYWRNVRMNLLSAP